MTSEVVASRESGYRFDRYTGFDREQCVSAEAVLEMPQETSEWTDGRRFHFHMKRTDSSGKFGWLRSSQ